jgi:hypothetical protein
MTTEWTTPTIFSQYVESGAETAHIPWNDSNGWAALLNRNVNEKIGTNGTLTHIARSPKHDILSKTYYVKCQGFNFVNLPDSPSGIELRLTTQRRGRITDETIQLCFDNNTISENLADLIVDPVKIYGGSTSLWSVKNLSMSTIEDSKFGVVIRLQSHPNYPHRDEAYINAVELRIH